MSEPMKGLFAIIAASTIWGLSPLFYKALAHIDPLEIQSHRVIWSLVFFGAFLVWQNRVGAVISLLSQWRNVVSVGFAALMISTNWFIFIWSIQVGRAVENSLGYYIFPLVAALLGVVFFKERLSRAGTVAVVLASIAVLVLTVGLGALPWISMALAISFSLYGVMKKAIDAGPVVSVTAEVLILAPLALIFLGGAHFQGWTGISHHPGGFFGQNINDSVMLALSGPITATPLMLFSYASKRVSFVTVGLVQYVNPTLQFGCAVLIFGELFTPYHGAAFGLIWVSLVIYSGAALRSERIARKRAVKRSTSSQTSI